MAPYLWTGDVGRNSGHIADWWTTGFSWHAAPHTVISALTDVPLDRSPELTPEVTPEGALDSTLDLPLDLRPVTSQAREYTRDWARDSSPDRPLEQAREFLRGRCFAAHTANLKGRPVADPRAIGAPVALLHLGDQGSTAANAARGRRSAPRQHGTHRGNLDSARPRRGIRASSTRATTTLRAAAKAGKASGRPASRVFASGLAAASVCSAPGKEGRL